MDWSTSSPDINTVDFSNWGYIKDNVYETPVLDLPHFVDG